MRMTSKLLSFTKHSLPFLTSHPLWKGKNYLPLLRFLRLQAIFALGEREIWMPWMSGVLLPLRQGDTGLTGNYYAGLHEYRDMAFAAHFLAPGDLFIDIGANLGSYSLIASALCGARSIAFEPVPTTFERLKRIIQANDLDQFIEARCLALTSEAEAKSSNDLWFSIDRDCCNSFVSSDYPGDKRRVAVSTLDHELSGYSPVLLKIDVEGFEHAVLTGASNVLASQDCLAIIIEGQADPVNKYLAETGFVEVDYDPGVRSIVQASSIKTPNKIWIKQESIEDVAERLKSAPQLEVYGQKF